VVKEREKSIRKSYDTFLQMKQIKSTRQKGWWLIHHGKQFDCVTLLFSVYKWGWDPFVSVFDILYMENNRRCCRNFLEM